jgi:hypothetical protein
VKNLAIVVLIAFSSSHIKKLTNNNIDLLLMGGGQVVDNVGDKSFHGGGVLEDGEHILEDDSLRWCDRVRNGS